MTGGLRETASLMAIAALSCVMGATVFGAKPAKAADLGGDCCADLEERVADLEATTVRKGNKKVSVQIYGKVNYAAMWWDDGGEQNFYVVNNYNESTRTGIKGKAKIAARCYSSSDQYNCLQRRNGVAYSSPDLKGLLEGWNVQWGWFEDHDWGAALRYKNSFSPWGGGTGASADDTWLFSANVAYENLRDERLQGGGGGLASGIVPIPQSGWLDRQQADLLRARVQRVGRFDRRSSTSRAASLSWEISARPNLTTPMSEGSIPATRRQT